jgi:hypothetical protein
VTGGTSTMLPTDTIKFPRSYNRNGPSFNLSIYGGYQEYPMPGPAVWGGSGSGSSSNASSANAASDFTVLSFESKSIVIHDDSSGESKKNARGRRAFREPIRQEYVPSFAVVGH